MDSYLNKKHELVLLILVFNLHLNLNNFWIWFQVGKLYVFGPLVNIIKTVCRDSIVGRACRVIGNLAQKTSNAEGLHNHGVVTALVALIENRDKNTSYPTLTMAVRAIR